MSTAEKRPYRLGRRAEKQAETRQRIVEAAVELHSTIGPAATSLSAVAARAGVQRHTLYAHFPDEDALFAACTGHWAALHPFPDTTAWWQLEDPVERLRTAVGTVYAWYREIEDDFVAFRRDAHLQPAFWAARQAELDALADGLARGLPGGKAARAAIGHALEFETWRSLVRTQGLDDAAAIELVERLVAPTG